MYSEQKSKLSELLVLRLFLATVILISFGMVVGVTGLLGFAVK